MNKRMRDIKIRLVRIRALLRAWEQAENESEGSSLWIQFNAELQDLWEHVIRETRKGIR